MIPTFEQHNSSTSTYKLANEILVGIMNLLDKSVITDNLFLEFLKYNENRQSMEMLFDEQYQQIEFNLKNLLDNDSSNGYTATDTLMKTLSNITDSKPFPKPTQIAKASEHIGYSAIQYQFDVYISSENVQAISNGSSGRTRWTLTLHTPSLQEFLHPHRGSILTKEIGLD